MSRSLTLEEVDVIVAQVDRLHAELMRPLFNLRMGEARTAAARSSTSPYYTPARCEAAVRLTRGAALEIDTIVRKYVNG